MGEKILWGKKFEKLQKNIEDNFRKVLNSEVSPKSNETKNYVGKSS